MLKNNPEERNVVNGIDTSNIMTSHDWHTYSCNGTTDHADDNRLHVLG